MLTIRRSPLIDELSVAIADIGGGGGGTARGKHGGGIRTCAITPHGACKY